MNRKFYIPIIMLLLLSACNKDYFNGITNFKNWTTNAHPDYGLALVDAGVGYRDLINLLPDESNSLHIVVDGSRILHIVSTQNIFSAYDDLFKVDNIDINESLPLPFSLPAGTDIPFYDISLADLIGNNDFAEVADVVLGSGTFTLTLDGDLAKSIGSISLSMGGISTTQTNSVLTAEGKLVMSISFDTLHPLLVTNNSLAVMLNATLKQALPAGSYALRMVSQEVQLHSVTIHSFQYTTMPIKASILMDYINEMSEKYPDPYMQLKSMKVIVKMENLTGLQPTIKDLGAKYIFCDGSSQTNSFPNINGGQPYQEDVFNFEKGISSLVKQVDFTAGLLLWSPAEVFQIKVSKAHNLNVTGTVDVPLVANVQNFVFTKSFDLPADIAKYINTIDFAWVSMLTANSFPLMMKSSYLMAIDNNDKRVDSISLYNFINGDDATIGIKQSWVYNKPYKIPMSKSFANNFFEYRKGAVVINLQTKNDATAFSAFKDTDSLHIKLGLGVRVNGKNLFEQLK